MGSGISAGFSSAVSSATNAELENVVNKLSAAARNRLCKSLTQIESQMDALTVECAELDVPTEAVPVSACDTEVMRPSFFSAAISATAQGKGLPKKSQMLELFQRDLCSGLLARALPTKPLAPNVMRIAQWNINALRGLYGDGPDIVDPEEILQILDSIVADVLVLQEFCRAPEEVDEPKLKAGSLADGLRRRGYQVFTSQVEYPTVFASRLAVDGEVPSIPLYEEPAYYNSERAALCAQVLLTTGQTVTIYATHFHHQNLPKGIRRKEAEVISRHCANSGSMDATLIVGDFNQQRRCDYSSAEWDILAAIKAQFREPEDDGVCTRFAEAGFYCVLDAKEADRNWPREAMPPPTHWTGTVIDYSFARGLVARGMYVVPLSKEPAPSDHLPLVCDWEIPM